MDAALASSDPRQHKLGKCRPRYVGVGGLASNELTVVDGPRQLGKTYVGHEAAVARLGVRQHHHPTLSPASLRLGR